jgi:hypothetical protein
MALACESAGSGDCVFRFTLLFKSHSRKQCGSKTSSTADAVPLPQSGKAFLARGPARTGAFPRGEGAEPARRMRCHRAKKLRDMDLWLPYEMNQRIKSQQISYTSSQNCDIVSGGRSIFRPLHFGSTFFSSYIRYRSFFLKPHPPLTRSPFSDHGEGFLVRGPARTGAFPEGKVPSLRGG